MGPDIKGCPLCPCHSLHLISIGQLCNNGLFTTFNSADCNFRNKNSKVIAGGIRAGKDLYHFNGNPLIVEHVNIACAIPNLETWHCHLGHISYQSVFDMSKKGLTQGMPTNLSTFPAICEHCIFGKQTKHLFRKSERGQGQSLSSRRYIQILLVPKWSCQTLVTDTCSI